MSSLAGVRDASLFERHTRAEMGIDPCELDGDTHSASAGVKNKHKNYNL